MVTWDRDRYEQLQDSAWELEILATQQDRQPANSGARAGATSRAQAGVLRQDAAHLLARYWGDTGRSRNVTTSSVRREGRSA